MRHTPIRIAGALGLAAALSVGAVACGSDSDSSSSGSSDTSMMQSSTTMAEAMGDLTEANFGPGCAAVPTSGAGSFDGMAEDPAATAASNNPALSTLVTAVTAAGLGDTLNGEGPFTIFAPTNDAFAKIPAATLDSVLADPSGALTKILTYHVISGKSLNAAELAEAGTETTVEGSTVEIAESGETIEVNGTSAVVCGNVKVGNGTVQIIDTVLMPPGM
jgi:transforming growth factor-beta-induced protein